MKWLAIDQKLQLGNKGDDNGKKGGAVGVKDKKVSISNSDERG